MKPAAAIHRPQLENLILCQLRELKGLESGLDKQFANLRYAPARTRESFLQKLTHLEERAVRLERLVDSLDGGFENVFWLESHFERLALTGRG